MRAVCIERCMHGSEGGVVQSRPDSMLLPYGYTSMFHPLASLLWKTVPATIAPIFCRFPKAATPRDGFFGAGW